MQLTSTAQLSITHNYQDLIAIFAACFFEQYNTRLVLGDNEPLYRPANESCLHHSIIFAHGFFSSALHESAHWLIAGEKRRLIEDYGYWYVPDGRNESQQQEFQKVEAKPQALEWLLCLAANFPFQLSVDNLGGIEVDRKAFLNLVYQEVLNYCNKGLPLRAKHFYAALAEFYGGPKEPDMAVLKLAYERALAKLL